MNLPPDLILSLPDKNAEFEQVNSPNEYIMKLQQALQELNKMARENAKNSSFRISRYYDMKLSYHEFVPGDMVYYHNPTKGKNTSKSCFHPWDGPYIISKKLGNCLYKIQKSRKSEPMVVHHNKLKRCLPRKPVDTSWVLELEKNPPVEVTHEETPSQQVNRPRHPSVQQPNRLEEWVYKY